MAVLTPLFITTRTSLPRTRSLVRRASAEEKTAGLAIGADRVLVRREAGLPREKKKRQEKNERRAAAEAGLFDAKNEVAVAVVEWAAWLYR